MIIRYAAIILLFLLPGCHSTPPSGPASLAHNPAEGYVPDADTATGIAESIGSAFYGKPQILWEKPLKAKLDGDIWEVTGTLPKDSHLTGGTLKMRISKKDGRVLLMTHSQ